MVGDDAYGRAYWLLKNHVYSTSLYDAKMGQIDGNFSIECLLKNRSPKEEKKTATASN